MTPRYGSWVALALGICALACEQTPALDQKTARAAIEESAAFKGSWDPSLRIDGAPMAPDPSWHREIVRVAGVEIHGSGMTAIAQVGFTWRWNAGPLDEGAVFQATAMFLYGKGVGWSLQEKRMRNEIWKQEGRAE